MPTMLAPLDLTLNEIQNVLIQMLPTDPASGEARLYYNTVAHTLRFYNGSAWVSLGRLDQISVPTSAVNMNSQLLTGLATPVGGTDAATKAYVDGISQGVAWKAPVRAATATPGTLASSFASGQAIDGVTLATGDRILVKDQATGGENGIYTVNASGAPTRAADSDTAAEVLQAAVLVEEGTVNADRLFVNTTNNPITLGTTALVFVQIGGATSYTAGNGITIAGTTITAVVAPSGGLTLTASGLGLGTVTVALGGTGATTAAGARANLGVPGKYSQAIGDGSATSIAVVHNLGSQNAQATVRRTGTPFEQVLPNIQYTDANTCTFIFSVAPTTNQYTVTIEG